LKGWVKIYLLVGISSYILLIDILEINIRGFIQIPETPNQDIIPSSQAL
jgi:hypothetical protein